MEILSIIPARGGSKGVPRKNIRLMNGKPLISYSILSSIKSELITRTIVSSDDEEILSIAKKYNADVPFVRPSELAQDHITDFPVFDHCLKWLRDNENYIPDIIVHLRPTSPFRDVKDIDACIKKLKLDDNADSIRSVCRVSQHPLKMWKISDDKLEPFFRYENLDFSEPFNMPRQKLPFAYVQNGCIDVIRYNTIMKYGSMSGNSILPYIMNIEDAVNIDTELDWSNAAGLMKKRNRK
jgi:CMP-N,N'-diacetyllegionaminic acid synthase